MGRHENTLAAIFAEPTRANVKWNDIESLFRHYGADITEGRGSRVRVFLYGVNTVLHQPHPRKEVGKAALRSVRALLQSAGIQP